MIEENTVEALRDEYQRVLVEKNKGATVWGLFQEPIDEVLARLHEQLRRLGYVIR